MPPTMGAAMKSHKSDIACPPATSAGPKPRAGLTDVLVTGIDIRWMAVKVRPMAMGAKWATPTMPACGNEKRAAHRTPATNRNVPTNSAASARALMIYSPTLSSPVTPRPDSTPKGPRLPCKRRVRRTAYGVGHNSFCEESEGGDVWARSPTKKGGPKAALRVRSRRCYWLKLLRRRRSGRRSSPWSKLQRSRGRTSPWRRPERRLRPGRAAASWSRTPDRRAYRST
jgi:hypothetical protein